MMAPDIDKVTELLRTEQVLIKDGSVYDAWLLSYSTLGLLFLCV